MKSSGSFVIIAAVTFLVLPCLLVVHAQQDAPKRNIITKQDLTGFAGHEGVVALVEFAPGAQEPKHTHPGDVFGYVQEGTLKLHVEGRPDTTVKQGEVFFVPAGKVHWAVNEGTTPVKTVATFVVEKGKPLASPAPMTDDRIRP
ncbi:MAG TPA: cupin domain-containing protein [Candidatus Angelobacter sp.]|nr:cupin domain-containing protein [Candidatus Angelobacter sp.]